MMTKTSTKDTAWRGAEEDSQAPIRRVFATGNTDATGVKVEVKGISILPKDSRVSMLHTKAVKMILIIAACLLAASCSADKEAPLARLSVEVRLTVPLGTESTAARLWVWSISDNLPEITNAQQLSTGLLEGVPAFIAETDLNGFFSHDLPQGEYLVAVMLGNASEGRYSFLTRQTFEGTALRLVKVFDAAEPAVYEEW